MWGILLQDYLLLDLGRAPLLEVESWQRDMAARRRAEASRDLLAFWRPKEAEGGYRNGQLVALPIVGLRRFPQDLTPEQVLDGLLEAVRKALEHFGIQAEELPARTGLTTGGRRIATLTGTGEDGVVHARLTLALTGEAGEGEATVQEVLGRELEPRLVADAIAWHVEQAFGYAQAAQHPVAYEESMRPSQ